MTDAKSLKSDDLRGRAEKFFMGYYYPIITVLLVLLGHITAWELFFGAISVLLFCTALLTCKSIRPIIVFAISFVYQVPLVHAPGVPTFSPFYTSSYGLAIVVVFIILMAAALVYFVVKNKIFSDFKFKSAPLLLPITLLIFAFMMNGAFDKDWQAFDLLYGIGQLLVYGVFFYLLYYGLKKEDTKELLQYFVYVSALIALLLVSEVAHLYIVSDEVIVNGSIVKEKILFGWGIWNTAGAALSVLIPICFLGVIKCKHTWFYFITATLTLLACVFTLSRGSLLFGGICYVVCVIICCFKGKNKKAFRWVTLAGILLTAVGTVVLWDKISTILLDFLERGFSDNGRFELWKTAVENFKQSPMFGVGFFAFVSDTFVAGKLVPKMAHNTILQLMSSMGIVGLLTYIYYRVSTVIPFIKKFSIEKLMLLLSVVVLLSMSMLDNHIFYFQPILHYSVVIVIALLMNENDEKTVNTPTESETQITEEQTV